MKSIKSTQQAVRDDLLLCFLLHDSVLLPSVFLWSGTIVRSTKRDGSIFILCIYLLLLVLNTANITLETNSVSQGQLHLQLEPEYSQIQASMDICVFCFLQTAVFKEPFLNTGSYFY